MFVPWENFKSEFQSLPHYKGKFCIIHHVCEVSMASSRLLSLGVHDISIFHSVISCQVFLLLFKSLCPFFSGKATHTKWWGKAVTLGSSGAHSHNVQADAGSFGYKNISFVLFPLSTDHQGNISPRRPQGDLQPGGGSGTGDQHASAVLHETKPGRRLGVHPGSREPRLWDDALLHAQSARAECRCCAARLLYHGLC